MAWDIYGSNRVTLSILTVVIHVLARNGGHSDVEFSGAKVTLTAGVCPLVSLVFFTSNFTDCIERYKYLVSTLLTNVLLFH